MEEELLRELLVPSSLKLRLGVLVKDCRIWRTTIVC